MDDWDEKDAKISELKVKVSELELYVGRLQNTVRFICKMVNREAGFGFSIKLKDD